jgi:glutathione S-transferase
LQSKKNRTRHGKKRKKDKEKKEKKRKRRKEKKKTYHGNYRYLCEKYDTSHRLLPTETSSRILCRRWMHAAEATYALHGLAILYTRWFGSNTPSAALEIEKAMSTNVIKDMDFLEAELQKSTGRFLIGDQVTAADCMMMFSAQFILTRKLGTEGKKWEGVERWIKECEATESYKRAVEKTGHSF